MMMCVKGRKETNLLQGTRHAVCIVNKICKGNFYVEWK